MTNSGGGSSRRRAPARYSSGNGKQIILTAERLSELSKKFDDITKKMNDVETKLDGIESVLNRWKGGAFVVVALGTIIGWIGSYLDTFIRWIGK